MAIEKTLTMKYIKDLLYIMKNNCLKEVIINPYIKLISRQESDNTSFYYLSVGILIITSTNKEDFLNQIKKSAIYNKSFVEIAETYPNYTF